MNTEYSSIPKPFQNLRNILLSPWFFAVFMVFIVVCFFFIDQPIALYFQSLDLNETAFWLRWITHLGLGGGYIIGLFLLALCARYILKNREWENKLWFLWLCVIIPSLICVALKFLMGRSRPTLLFNHDMYGFHGFETSAAYWSFPSGHTTTIMGLAFGLCIIFPKRTYSFITAGLIIAVSRVLLTNHFLSDVLIAAYLSFLEVSIILYWMNKKELWRQDFFRIFCLKKYIN